MVVASYMDPDCNWLPVGNGLNLMLESFPIKKNHPMLQPLSDTMRILQVDGTIEKLMQRFVLLFHSVYINLSSSLDKKLFGYQN